MQEVSLARCRRSGGRRASFDDEFSQVDHARAGVDVDRPVGDAERREDDRKHDARVPVDGVGATHVRVLSGRGRRCRRRRRRRRLGLYDLLFGVRLHGHLLLLLLVLVVVIVVALMRLARRRRAPVRASCWTHRGGVRQQADFAFSVRSPHPAASLLHSQALTFHYRLLTYGSGAYPMGYKVQCWQFLGYKSLYTLIAKIGLNN